MGELYLWWGLDGDNPASPTDATLNEVIDLYASADYFRVREDWIPETAEEDDVTMEQTIPLFIPNGTTAANILAELVRLDEMSARAREFRTDFTQERAVFLVYKTDPGPAMKTWVKKLRFNLRSDVASNAFIEYTSAHLELMVEHHPVWETLLPVTRADISAMDQAFNTSNNGVAWGAAVDGTLNARIRSMEIYPTASVTNNIEKIWVAFKRDTGHGLNNFSPFVTFSTGINVGELHADTSVQISLGSSTEGGNALRTTFSTSAAFVKRAYIGVWGESIPASSEDQYRGRYVLLMSARTQTAAATCYVQCRHGYAGMDDTDFIGGNIVEVTDSDYHIFTMGTFRTPLFPSVGKDGLVAQHITDQRFHVYAERVSGTGILDIDAFVAMPLDAYIAGTRLRADFSGQHADLRTRPDDQIVAFSFSGNTIDIATSLAPQNWGVPWGPAPRIYILMEGDVEFLFSRDAEIDNIEYFPRTRHIHGN